MSAMIHIWRDGETFGPYPQAEAVQYFAEGSLVPTDLAWYEGLEEWQPAADILQPKPKPVPKPAIKPAPVARKASPEPRTQAATLPAKAATAAAADTGGQLKWVLAVITLVVVAAIAVPIYLKMRTGKKPKVAYEDAGLPQNFGTDGNPDLRALSEVLKQCVMTPGQTMPKTLQDLVGRKFIRQLPAPPAGQGYWIDSTNLIVKLVPIGK